MHMRLRLFAMLLWLAAGVPGRAAEFAYDQRHTVTLSGEIEVGDDAEFEQFASSLERGKHVELNLRSPGGDLATALNIGRIVRQKEMNTTTRECLSSCVFIMLGGVRRQAFFVGDSEDPKIGIHRFHFASLGAASTNAEIKKRYVAGKKMIEEYLQEMNISPELLSAMDSVPPNQVHILSEAEAKRYGVLGTDPVFDEKLTAQLAYMHGISSAEYRRREMAGESLCEERFKMPPITRPYKRYREASSDITIKRLKCEQEFLYQLPYKEIERRKAILRPYWEKFKDNDQARMECHLEIVVKGRSGC